MIGDAMIDQYVSGEFGRISSEWGMPIFKSGKPVLLPGGAANVAWELVKHQQDVQLICLNDAHAVDVFEEHGIKTNAIGKPVKLPVKTRFFNQGIPVTLRWDCETEPRVQNILFDEPKAKVCIAVDYDKGFFASGGMYESFRDCITIADSKSGKFFKPTVYKLNSLEAQQQTGTSDLVQAATILKDRTQAKYVVITNGAQGFHLFDGYGHGKPNPEPVEVKNVVGAGDAFTAHLAIALKDGEDIEQACKYANAKSREYVTAVRGVQF